MGYAPFLSQHFFKRIFLPFFRQSSRIEERPTSLLLAPAWHPRSRSPAFLQSKRERRCVHDAPPDIRRSRSLQTKNHTRLFVQDGHVSNLPYRRGGRRALRQAAPGQARLRGCQGEDWWRLLKFVIFSFFATECCGGGSISFILFFTNTSG